MLDTNSWLMIGVIALLVLSFARNPHAAQLRRIENKLDAISRHLKLDLPPGLDAHIMQLASSGKKIEAIKLYREQSGVDLREAKRIIDGL